MCFINVHVSSICLLLDSNNRSSSGFRSFSEIIQISEVKLSEATASAPDHLLQLQALQIFTRKSILVSAPHPSAELSEQLSVISVRVSHCSFLKGIQSCCLDVSALCCVLCQDDPTL